MRIFKEPNNTADWKCPICKTNDIKPVTLVEIIGTQEGNNIEAEQIHVDCIQLSYDRKYQVLIQNLR